MALYLMSYDLRKVRNYAALHKQLNAWSAQRVLESVWLAQLTGPAEKVHEILRTHIDGDDGLFVIELSSHAEWATIRVKPEGLRWLRAHIPSRLAA